MTRGTGPTMAERVRRSAGQVDSPWPVRHVWVADPADRIGVKRPGLLVEWRRTGTGDWEGRVLYGAQLRMSEWAVVEEWIPEALLSPV